jgi:hypothetical protein
MTDTNFISSEPRNKSFDEDIIYCGLREKKISNNNSKNQLSKVCFNPYCNNIGNNLIQIIGTDTEYRDRRIPFCVCEECFLPFTGWGPGRNHNESMKSMPELKICYYHLCNNNGKYWIDVYKKAITESDPDDRWTGQSTPYWLCEKCYAFLEYKRKDLTFLFTKTFDKRIQFSKQPKEENRIGVTVKDFCDLLESFLERTMDKSDRSLTFPTTQTQALDSNSN